MIVHCMCPYLLSFLDTLMGLSGEMNQRDETGQQPGCQCRSKVAHDAGTQMLFNTKESQGENKCDREILGFLTLWFP